MQHQNQLALNLHAVFHYHRAFVCKDCSFAWTGCPDWFREAVGGPKNDKVNCPNCEGENWKTGSIRKVSDPMDYFNP